MFDVVAREGLPGFEVLEISCKLLGNTTCSSMIRREILPPTKTITTFRHLCGLLKSSVTRNLFLSLSWLSAMEANTSTSQHTLSYVIYGSVVAELRQESVHPHQAQVH